MFARYARCSLPGIAALAAVAERHDWRVGMGGKRKTAVLGTTDNRADAPRPAEGPALDPLLGGGQFAAGVAGVRGSDRLDEKHVGLVVCLRAVLDAAGDDE